MQDNQISFEEQQAQELAYFDAFYNALYVDLTVNNLEQANCFFESNTASNHTLVKRAKFYALEKDAKVFLLNLDKKDLPLVGDYLDVSTEILENIYSNKKLLTAPRSTTGTQDFTSSWNTHSLDSGKDINLALFLSKDERAKVYVKIYYSRLIWMKTIHSLTTGKEVFEKLKEQDEPFANWLTQTAYLHMSSTSKRAFLSLVVSHDVDEFYIELMTDYTLFKDDLELTLNATCLTEIGLDQLKLKVDLDGLLLKEIRAAAYTDFDIADNKKGGNAKIVRAINYMKKPQKVRFEKYVKLLSAKLQEIKKQAFRVEYYLSQIEGSFELEMLKKVIKFAFDYGILTKSLFEKLLINTLVTSNAGREVTQSKFVFANTLTEVILEMCKTVESNSNNQFKLNTVGIHLSTEYRLGVLTDVVKVTKTDANGVESVYARTCDNADSGQPHGNKSRISADALRLLAKEMEFIEKSNGGVVDANLFKISIDADNKTLHSINNRMLAMIQFNPFMWQLSFKQVDASDRLNAVLNTSKGQKVWKLLTTGKKQLRPDFELHQAAQNLMSA